MKRLKMLLLTLISTLFLSQCAGLNVFKTKPQIPVEQAKPKHVGPGETGSYGLYDYVVYRWSVSIKAVSPVVTVTEAQVYDMNRDGRLDSVFVYQKGAWYFISLLGPQYRLIPNTADKSILRDYLMLANYARKEVARKKEALQKQKKESSQEYPNMEIQKMFPYNNLYYSN